MINEKQFKAARKEQKIKPRKRRATDPAKKF
jgi:hypothetical protein